jgi:hypothetical protein
VTLGSGMEAMSFEWDLFTGGACARQAVGPILPTGAIPSYPALPDQIQQGSYRHLWIPALCGTHVVPSEAVIAQFCWALPVWGSLSHFFPGWARRPLFQAYAGFSVYEAQQISHFLVEIKFGVVWRVSARLGLVVI